MSFVAQCRLSAAPLLHRISVWNFIGGRKEDRVFCCRDGPGCPRTVEPQGEPARVPANVWRAAPRRPRWKTGSRVGLGARLEHRCSVYPDVWSPRTGRTLQSPWHSATRRTRSRLKVSICAMSSGLAAESGPSGPMRHRVLVALIRDFRVGGRGLAGVFHRVFLSCGLNPG